MQFSFFTAFRREKPLIKDPYSLDFFLFSNHLTRLARNSNKGKLKIGKQWFAKLYALFFDYVSSFILKS